MLNGMKAIDKALKNAPELNLSDYPRIVLFSDCHRGCGTWNDGFLNNKTIYEAAINYYFDNDFTYMELGDGDELWENRYFDDIYAIHRDIFDILQKFLLRGRLFMLWGNHDRIKAKKNHVADNSKFSPEVHEAIVLSSPVSGHRYNLLHGHQPDFLNNQCWKLARWLVRYIWKPLELSGIKDPTSAAKNYEKKKRIEHQMAGWIDKHGESIICGHTHRPAMPANTQLPGYYNTGSCVHPNNITCIEMIYGKINLIKWTTCVDEKQYMYVCRQVIK